MIFLPNSVKLSFYILTHFEVSYIDIDLRGGADLEWQQVKLRYLALLSIMVESDNAYLGSKYQIFIMKKWNADIQASIDDPNSIAVFDHKYITRFQPIFSRPGAVDTSKVRYQEIKLSGYYEDTSWDSKWSNRWSKDSNFIPIWASTNFPKINDFEYYSNFIRAYKTRND